MNRKQLIKKYIDFFKSKDHKEIPNASLIPQDDPTVLFTTAGMHPLVPYLLGQKHPLGKRLVSVQRCIRTGDIEEVGNKTHHTFFEMLGNWSLGDYWKEDAIEYSFEFLTKTLKIPKEKLAVTCFKGDKNAPKDTESAEVWKSLGIKKIKFLGKEDNWWGPAGKTGPCGPDSEIFYINKKGKEVEIWNNVFMQYNKDEKGTYKKAKQKNVDTGMGVERTIAVLNGLEDNYMTDCFKPIIEKIEKLSGKPYKGNEKAMRIIADHIKASIFIIGEGINPGKGEREYIPRKLIRRAIYHGRQTLGILNFTRKVAEPVFEIYKDYLELGKNKRHILEELGNEEIRFNKKLGEGINRFVKTAKKSQRMPIKDIFLLFQSFGLPKEVIKEEFDKIGLSFPEKEFNKELSKHQKLSQTASKGKFKAGLADNSEQTTKLHTVTHLLHKALKKVLGEHVQQMGSNITPERLRFDFAHDKKMTDKEIKKTEEIVNKQIEKGLNVTHKEMPYKKAQKEKAESNFKDRYPEIVKVYSVGDFSKEICTGPHVKNTKEIGKFKIKKETSSSAGVRRIKAVLE